MEKFRETKEKIWGFLLDGLWIEGVRLFFSYWRSWLAVGGGVAVFLLFVDYLSDRFQGGVVWDIVRLLVLVALGSFFVICFLEQEPLSKPIRQNSRLLGRVFVYNIFLDFVEAGVLSLVLTRVYVLIAIGLFLGIWIEIRMFFVAPLAASGITLPIATSYHLTKGKFWRLLANFAMLGLMFFMPHFIVESVKIPVVDVVFQILATGIASAFACAACRVFYGENIVANLEQDRRAASRDVA
ncbi:MAG: hypothetical protein P4M13_09490 [Alphaproteobacteria bacterium]|nr:hypothetical protein [Alphaproteobacteria bacterium]